MSTLRRAWLADRLHRLAREVMDAHDVMRDEPEQGHAADLMDRIAEISGELTGAAELVAARREGDFKKR